MNNQKKIKCLNGTIYLIGTLDQVTDNCDMLYFPFENGLTGKFNVLLHFTLGGSWRPILAQDKLTLSNVPLISEYIK